MTEREVYEMINRQLNVMGMSTSRALARRRGRPYPTRYDLVPYPPGYVVPTFKSFSGEGMKDNNPYQHIAHFIASCGNTVSNDALLLRQFPQSLTGAAFEWYCSLEDESISLWDDMVIAFTTKFAVMAEKTTIADLATLKPKKDEPLLGILP